MIKQKKFGNMGHHNINITSLLGYYLNIYFWVSCIIIIHFINLFFIYNFYKIWKIFQNFLCWLITLCLKMVEIKVLNNPPSKYCNDVNMSSSKRLKIREISRICEFASKEISTCLKKIRKEESSQKNILPFYDFKGPKISLYRYNIC